MAIYFCTYAFFGALLVFLNKKIKDNHKRQLIGAVACFAVIFLILALRHPSMGTDLHYGQYGGYLWSFEHLSGKSWYDIITLESHQNYEKGYIILNKLIGWIYPNEQFFLACIAFLTFAPICFVIYKKSSSPVFSAIIYMGLPVFMLSYSGLRQCVAIGICFLSILFIEKKRPIIFLLTVALAMCFHTTAVLFILAYPLYYLKISKLIRAVSFVIPFLIYIFREPMFSIASRLIGLDLNIDKNNAINLFLLFMALYFFCSLYAKEEHQGLLNIYIIACCIQALAGLHSSIMRAGYYFTLPLVLLLPNIVSSIEDKKTRIIFRAGIFIFFVLFGIMNLYRTDWAMANPYIPFWRQIQI